MGFICVSFTKRYDDRCIYERLQCVCSVCKALLGFTVTLRSHCVPGCPPVSQWLGHSGPVCQLVDICLLPPPSVAMAAKPPQPPTPSPPDPSPHRPAFSTPLSCFPQTPAVNHLCLSCSPPLSALSYRRPAQRSFWDCRCTLLFVPVCWPTNTSLIHARWNWVNGPFRFTKNKLDTGKFAHVKWKIHFRTHPL